jgi:IclR family transcriptional regulator, acetate operon repressor
MQDMRSTGRTGTSVLERAFSLLEVLGSDGRSVGLAELARRAGLPKATAYRLANQLIDLHVLERAGHEYQLGLKLFELGNSVARQRELREAALPFMEDLYEATHETIHLGVLDDIEVLYVEKIAGRRKCTVPTTLGSRKPLYCTGLGKAILAYSTPQLVEAVIQNGLTRCTRYTIMDPHRLELELTRAAETGVAYDREEYELGITCVGSPLLNRAGRAWAAISVTGPTIRFRPERTAAAVRTAALGLTRVLAKTNQYGWGAIVLGSAFHDHVSAADVLADGASAPTCRNMVARSK